MKDLSTTSSDLFNKVRSRFSDVKIGDASGAITTDPNAARFFDVSYTASGKELGRVNIKLGEDSLTVIYNDSMLAGHTDEVRQDWFNFLKEIRQFARKNLLTFDTRDITKSNLEKRDYEYLSQNTGENKMSESKLFGTSKTSYQDVGEAKIIVKHSRPVNYNVPAGRSQHIDSIYIESANGERFRYPFKHLNGARAMATHVANGGTVYDSIGTHISGLSEELSKLRQFKNYTARNGVMAEALGDITSKVIERIDAVKEEISKLQKQTYYTQFKENFAVADRKEVPEDTVNQWVDALTIKTFNEELKSVFPYIYKLVSETSNELSYGDLVAEAEECGCEEPQEDEPAHSEGMFDKFAQHIETVGTPEFETDPHDEEGGEEDLQDEEPAEEPSRDEISKEVMEFIHSMYDSENGTFPRGEEGVVVATGKRFGDHAEKFARFVVAKLSSGQPEHQHAQDETLDAVSVTDPESDHSAQSPELDAIRRLSGLSFG